jgi:hypothetical protein
LVRSAGRLDRRVAAVGRTIGRASLSAFAATACIAAVSGAPRAADAQSAPPPAAPAASPAPAATPHGPLRHLVFAVTVGYSTENAMRTIDVAANRGGNTENYRADGHTAGTIDCDVVGVDGDGNLLVDVSESASDRSASKTRVAVQRDGFLVALPGQGPMTEEMSELVSLLSPGLLGGERSVGDSWTFRQTGKDYSATKTFHLASIGSPDAVNLDVEEVFSNTGVNAMSGASKGSMVYNPGGLVPLSLKLDRTMRQGDAQENKTKKISMDIVLKEDSLGKR